MKIIKVVLIVLSASIIFGLIGILGGAFAVAVLQILLEGQVKRWQEKKGVFTGQWEELIFSDDKPERRVVKRDLVWTYATILYMAVKRQILAAKVQYMAFLRKSSYSQLPPPRETKSSCPDPG